ncbi:MAG: hypothetical protein L3J75_07900 [Methylococcaceae bacterium]|nr:hypothetical protein [Methylococcaceae bacterium]
MAFNDSRQQFRRKVERRFVQRRVILHHFSTLNWLANIKHEQPLWPVQDRRSSDRRSFERRQIKSRRVPPRTTLSPISSKLNPLLTEGERHLLNDIFQQDKDKD